MASCLESFQQRSFLNAYNNTFELLSADTAELKEQAYKLRYDVYCLENNFEKPPFADEELEYDGYDERAIHHVLKHKPTGEIVGTLRVVLPNDEFPDESFPAQKACRHPLLHSDSRALTLFEISRFCTSKKFRKRERDGRTLSAYYEQDIVKGQSHNGTPIFIRRTIPYMAAALLQGAFETALSARILEGVWLVDSCHLSSLDKIGFSYKVLGPHVKEHGGVQPVVFNIKHVLDTMRRKNRHCVDLVADLGRLQKIADDLHQNDWKDEMTDDAEWAAYYERSFEPKDQKPLETSQ